MIASCTLLEELNFNNFSFQSKNAITKLNTILSKALMINKLTFNLPIECKKLKDLKKIIMPLRYLKVLTITGIDMPAAKIRKIF
jgi:hypothetical protein